MGKECFWGIVTKTHKIRNKTLRGRVIGSRWPQHPVPVVQLVGGDRGNLGSENLCGRNLESNLLRECYSVRSGLFRKCPTVKKNGKLIQSAGSGSNRAPASSHIVSRERGPRTTESRSNGESTKIQRENRLAQPEAGRRDGRVRADHAGSVRCHVQGRRGHHTDRAEVVHNAGKCQGQEGLRLQNRHPKSQQRIERTFFLRANSGWANEE